MIYIWFGSSARENELCTATLLLLLQPTPTTTTSCSFLRFLLRLWTLSL